MPPDFLRRWTPWGFLAGLVLLVLVLTTGEVGQGARRWLNLGIRFQPSEIMKLAVPMMAAWYLHDRPIPPKAGQLLVLALIIIIPTLLIARQPDLGTSLLIAASGIIVVVLAGLPIRLMLGLAVLSVPGAFVLWNFMQDYQKQRVLTLLDPDSDPLGAGYNIIQSKIAIGSGGLFGKGWTNGSQAQLEYLPERDTDFIFAVMGEELGLMGVLTLLCLYVFVIGRGLYISIQAPDTYSRLLAGSISLTFFVYVFVNTAMVTGLVPVVGIPLPLVSFGGTSMVTLLAGFGILMSIHSHRKLLPH
jgi:rod shape determining protein RodA